MAINRQILERNQTMKLSMKRMMSMTVGCGLALSGAGQAIAGSVTIPNSFTSGSAALAAEVNANLTASSVLETDSCTYTVSAAGELTLTWPDGSTSVIHMTPNAQMGVGSFNLTEAIMSGKPGKRLTSL
jgi:hypothetical protein